MIAEKPTAEQLQRIQDTFPGADLTALDNAGANEVVRILDILGDLGVEGQLLFGSIIPYAVAFQRWKKASDDVNALERDYVVGANSFMQTHPALQNQQKYFNILRSAQRQLLVDVGSIDLDSGGKKDGLEDHLNSRGKDD
jgi:hypothetical protein